MGFEFKIHSVESTRDIKETIDFLAAQDLGYPCYDFWVQRTETELLAGHKRAIIAKYNGFVVSDAVLQQHKETPLFLEVKNLRVHPFFRMREIGRFVLRQVEVEYGHSYHAIIGDVRANQSSLIRFMASCGYQPIITLPLYDSATPDIVMVKFLDGKRALFDRASVERVTQKNAF